MDKFEIKMICNWMHLLGVDVDCDTVTEVLSNDSINDVQPMIIVQIYKLHEVYQEIQNKPKSGWNTAWVGTIWEILRIPEKEVGVSQHNIDKFYEQVAEYKRDTDEYKGIAINILLSCVMTNAYGNYKYVMGSIIANEFLRWNKQYLFIRTDGNPNIFDELNRATRGIVHMRLLNNICSIEDDF